MTSSKPILDETVPGVRRRRFPGETVADRQEAARKKAADPQMEQGVPSDSDNNVQKT